MREEKENREERRRGKGKAGKEWDGRGEPEGEEQGSGKRRERDGKGGDRKGKEGGLFLNYFRFPLPSSDLGFRTLGVHKSTVKFLQQHVTSFQCELNKLYEERRCAKSCCELRCLHVMT